MSQDEALEIEVRNSLHHKVQVIGSSGSLALRSRERAGRRRRRRTAIVAACVVGAVVVVPWSVTRLSSHDATPVGPPPGPVIRSAPRGIDDVRMTADISGPLQLVENCLTLNDSLTVWPAETSWESGTSEIILPGTGARLPMGAMFKGGGGYLDPSMFEQENFASAADFDSFNRCVRVLKSTDVVVVNDVL